MRSGEEYVDASVFLFNQELLDISKPAELENLRSQIAELERIREENRLSWRDERENYENRIAKLADELLKTREQMNAMIHKSMALQVSIVNRFQNAMFI